MHHLEFFRDGMYFTTMVTCNFSGKFPTHQFFIDVKRTTKVLFLLEMFELLGCWLCCSGRPAFFQIRTEIPYVLFCHRHSCAKTGKEGVESFSFSLHSFSEDTNAFCPLKKLKENVREVRTTVPVVPR